MSVTHNIYYNIDDQLIVDNQGARINRIPQIAFQEKPLWRVNVVKNNTPPTALPLPYDLSSIVSMRAAIDVDFSSATEVMCRSNDDMIDLTRKDEGIIDVKLDAETAQFLAKVDRQTSPKFAYFELIGYDADGAMAFRIMFQIYALMLVDPLAGDPPPAPPDGYMSKAETLAVLRAVNDIQITDGVTWYDYDPDDEDPPYDLTTIIAYHYRNSAVEAEWSEPIPLLPGTKGDTGDAGEKGDPGDPGDSAYEIWLSEGNEGTEEDFLASLKGEKGDKGDPGEKGDPGNQGEQGLPGIQGADGIGTRIKGEYSNTETYSKHDAYTDAVTNQGCLWAYVNDAASSGNPPPTLPETSNAYWLLVVSKGEQGIQGEQGVKGEQGNQGVPGEKGDTGDAGEKGDPGDPGDSAYEIWLSEGNEGTEEDFLASLKGEKGDKGDPGDGGGGIDSVTTGAGLSGDGTETSPLTLGLTNYQTAASIDIQIADDMDERQYRIRLGDAAENVGYPTFELAQNRLGFYCDQKAQGIVYESTVLSLRNYGQEISGFANRTRIELAKSAGIGIYSYTGSLKFNGAELNTANGLLQLGDDNEIPEGFLATTTVAGIVLAGNATIAVAGTDTTQRAFSAADIKAAIEEHAPGGGDVPESRLIPDTAEFTKDDDGRILAYVSTASYYPDDAVLSQYDKYLKGYISFDQATADVSDYTLTYTATTAQPGSVSPKCAMSAWSGTGDRCPGAGRKSLIFNIWWYRTAAAAAKMLQIGDTANGLYLMFAGSVGIWQTSMLRGASMNGLSITSANNSWNFITIALTNTNKTVSCTLFGNGVKGSTHTVTVDDGFVFSASTAATLLSNFNTFYDEISWYEDLELTDAQILAMHQALYNSGAGKLPDFSSEADGAGTFTDVKMKFEGSGRKFLNDKGQYAYPSQGIWKMRCPVVAGKIVLAHGLNIKSEECAGLEVGVRLVKVSTTSESPPYGYATGDYATAIFIPLVYNTTGEIGWYENAKHCVELNRTNGTLSVYISGFYFQLGVNGTLAIDTATVSGSYLSFFDDLSAAEQATWNFEFYIKF